MTTTAPSVDELSLAITYNTDLTQRQAAINALRAHALELDAKRTTLLSRGDGLLGVILEFGHADLLAASRTAIRNELHRRALELDHHRTVLLTDDDTGLLSLILAKPAEYLPEGSALTATAIRTELHRRANRINHQIDDALTDETARALGHTVDTNRHGTPLCGVTVTRQALINALHRDALTTRANQAALVTSTAAVRHLADLIHQAKMDGEDVADMADDESNGMTLADRGAYPEVYVFLLAACDAFPKWSGYDLLQSATVTILGW